MLLSDGRMETGHWTMLFECRGHAGAYPLAISMHSLIELGVITNSAVVADTTTASHGEVHHESDFQALNAHWAEVALPVDQKEVALVLGSLDSLTADVRDWMAALNEMGCSCFVWASVRAFCTSRRPSNTLQQSLTQAAIRSELGHSCTKCSLSAHAKSSGALPDCPTQMGSLVIWQVTSSVTHVLSSSSSFCDFSKRV
jgi:hypothetical protein